MEFISKIRWVIVVFVLLFGLIFVGWGLSAIARNVFDGDSTSDSLLIEEDSVDISSLKTLNFTVDGPIVASEDHRSYTVEVSSSVVSMKVYSDYGQKIIDEKSYQNNDEAFESLAEALDKAGAELRYKNTTTEIDYDEKGACPTGKRYILDLGGVARRWSTSCQTVRGNAGGKMTTIRKLFEKQIPDFAELTKGTNLR